MEAETLAALASPGCYPGRPGEVDVIQTHLSVVCLAGDRAYKFKKAVHLPFADYRSLASRERGCRDEVSLNRRLCPDVYLGVLPLRRRPGGEVGFGDGPGEVIDYAVEMVRLPAGRMMDVLLAEGGVTRRDVEAIAEEMVQFHARADRGGRAARLGSPGRLRELALANFSETRGFAVTGELFDPALHRSLESRTAGDFASASEWLAARAARGCIVDGHGDLHARNICLLESGPVIYDCIEFSAAFRCGDVATENAFLAMDLAYRRRRDLADAYVESYIARSGDADMRHRFPVLVRFRAMVRAKVAALASVDSGIGAGDRAGAACSARRHLELAAASAVEEERPRLALVACGLPGSGKSTVFGRLARAGGWTVVATDRVRKELAGVQPGEPAPASAYEPEFSEKTYDEVLGRAAAALVDGPVLVDGNFRSRRWREAARHRLGGAGAEVRFAHFDIAGDVALERLRDRLEAGGSMSDAGPEEFGLLQSGFEPPGGGWEDQADHVCKLRCTRERRPEDHAAQLLAWLLG